MDARTRPLYRADVVIAAALTVAMSAAAAIGATGPVSGLGTAVVAAGLLALGARRRRPFAAAAAVGVVVVVETAAAPAAITAPAFLALMVASYSVGAHARGAALAGGVALGLATVAAAHLLAPPEGYSHAAAISFFGATLVLAPAAVGGAVRTAGNLSRRLRASTEAMRTGAAVRLADQRAADRARIDADIERIVLSGLERMRAHAAVRDLADVTALRDHGRDVLGRMRGLVGQLRQAGDDETPREPGRSVTQLRTQVKRVLSAGAADGLPPAVLRLRWNLLTMARTDTVLMVAAGVYALLVIAGQLADPQPTGQRLLACAAGAAAAVPLGWARRWPLTATTAGMVAATAFTWLTPHADPLGGLVAGAMLIGFPLVAGAAGDLPVAVAALIICLSATGVAVAVSTAPRPAWPDLLSSAAMAVGSWAAGRVLRAGATALADTAAARAAEEQRQRTALRRAVDEERARVARDLHDAVGHAMTGIVLQATAAARVWHSEPALAAGHVDALRDSLGEALDQLRPLVATLALGGSATPGLAAVAALVDRARACGLRSRLLIEGEGNGQGTGAPLDAAVDAVAYRILQEALTNAARHAPGAEVVIRIGHGPDTVVVEVRNDASPYQAAKATGTGHGLRGMAERASGCGGTLRAAATTGGGFQVRAVLPRAVPA
ncbi:sensor histidine kinase [Dactylosporangium sp. NPDC048998]|uniref:sensor histidine kinase n=1 Tax=Dactylosporangium sp. NPDC048998 TaxID=3363976 RepID=UPI00371C0BFD